MRRHREREITFDVPPSWQVPDARDLVPGGQQAERTVDELHSVYYDTDRGVLRRLGVSLRHRAGGADAGWHLKLTEGAARIELQSRARGAHVPVSLTRRLDGVLAGEQVRQIATITTNRHTIRLVDSAGGLIAELADDRVSAQRTGPSAVQQRWREVEVELGPAGDETLLTTIAKEFAKAGARPSRLQRKLSHLFEPDPVTAQSTVGQAVATYVQQQCHAVLVGDIAMRDRPDPRAVHKTRVGVRRLRSTLRNFGSALTLGPATLTRLDENLRWLAGLLSPIRDADILLRRLTAELTGLPPERVMGPVASDIQKALVTERAAGVRRWKSSWRDERYTMLMATLVDWLVTPPAVEHLNGRTVLKKNKRKVQRRLKRAADDPARLHRARKAAKRLRYAAELLKETEPKAGRLAKKTKKLQTILGDHQDFVIAADFLRRQGAHVGVQNGHNGFTYGLLTARVEQKAAAIRQTL